MKTPASNSICPGVNWPSDPVSARQDVNVQHVHFHIARVPMAGGGRVLEDASFHGMQCDHM